MAEVLIGSMTMPVVQASALELSQITNNSSIEQNLKGDTSTTVEGLKYEILTDRTGISITGYKGTATEVSIPETIENLPVVEIGNNAFYQCSILTKIYIPTSVIVIGESAFLRCSSLTTITVNEQNINYASVDGVLYNKEKTKICCYPAGKIGTSYTILNSATEIENSAFSGCSNLTTIQIPDGVTSIGYSVFSGCSSLTQINIPESVTNIGDRAFSGCSSLTQINIPDGITSIDSRAFNECSSLTQINIPESVTNIGLSVFSGCSSLTTITVNEQNINYASVDGVLYNKEKTKICCYPAGKIGTSYTILNSATEIEISAFSGCSNLTTIDIPADVTEIGAYAFSGCSSLTQIKIPTGVTKIEDYVFNECSSLIVINIPTGVTSVDSGAFSKCSSLTAINIPNGVTNIDDSIFYGCSSLTQINIPDSVTNIGDSAFSRCSSLTQINMPDGVTSIGSNAFYECIGLTEINIPDSVTSIGNSVFYGCSSLTQINIPDSVTNIGDSAFSRCSSLTQINMPDNVTSIGNSAFSGCSSLTQINIPTGVTKIENYVFEECSSLTQINIPDGVTSIGEYAFYACVSLTEIEIPDSAEIIGSNAFSNCDLVEVNIPAGVKNIGTTKAFYAFSDNYNLNSINVDEENENFTSIDGVLYNKNMTELLHWPPAKVADSYVIPNTVQKINLEGFRYAKGLKKLTISKNVKDYYDSSMFFKSSIQNLILEEGLTVMPLLSAMTDITEVVIPTTITKLEGRVFEGCLSLERVVIPKGVTYIDKDIFNYSNFEFKDEYGNIVEVSNKAIIMCAEGSVAKQFATENNVRYIVDSTYPIISGVENNTSYKTEVTPTVSDDKLKVVNLYKNGNIVNNYKNGDKISENGIYKLVAKDIVGNETKVIFAIGTQLVKGDVTGDGKITATDILKIKKHIVGLELLNDEQILLGDINEDDKMTVTDLLKAKKKFVGLE